MVFGRLIKTHIENTYTNFDVYFIFKNIFCTVFKISERHLSLFQTNESTFCVLSQPQEQYPTSVPKHPVYKKKEVAFLCDVLMERILGFIINPTYMQSLSKFNVIYSILITF